MNAPISFIFDSFGRAQYLHEIDVRYQVLQIARTSEESSLALRELLQRQLSHGGNNEPRTLSSSHSELVSAIVATVGETAEHLMGELNSILVELEGIRGVLDRIETLVAFPATTALREKGSYAKECIERMLTASGDERAYSCADAERLLREITADSIGGLSARAWLDLGWLELYERSRPIDAAVPLYHALRLGKDVKVRALARRFLGQAYYLQGDYQRARETLEGAKEYYMQSDVEGLYDLARYSVLTGKRGEAVVALEAVFRRAPHKAVTATLDPDMKSFL